MGSLSVPGQRPEHDNRRQQRDVGLECHVGQQRLRRRAINAGSRENERAASRSRPLFLFAPTPKSVLASKGAAAPAAKSSARKSAAPAKPSAAKRSEERRVGKE